MFLFAVSETDAGTRLDHFLTARLPDLSRSRIQALIRGGQVRLDEAPARASEKLRAGQRVEMAIPQEPVPSPLEAQPIPLDVLYEDGDLIVINKPAGLVVHPAAGNPDGTLVNALLHHCDDLSGIGGEERPGIVHRLDKETSGAMVIAKNDAAHQGLAAQFAARDTLKIYLAGASGHFRVREGQVDAPIGRHPVHRKKMAVLSAAKGRVARTGYRVLHEWGEGKRRASLVECTLHTGRTHQIRVHLHHLGHPLLGDLLYGRREDYPRQMLHAWKLGFAHPRTGERLEFAAAIPDDFRALTPFLLSL